MEKVPVNVPRLFLEAVSRGYPRGHLPREGALPSTGLCCRADSF